jgi:hypothetical protein
MNVNELLVELKGLIDGFIAVDKSLREQTATQKLLLDAALIDASRYRSIRRGQHWSVINGIGDALRAETLDAAIDAAIGEPHAD